MHLVHIIPSLLTPLEKHRPHPRHLHRNNIPSHAKTPLYIPSRARPDDRKDARHQKPQKQRHENNVQIRSFDDVYTPAHRYLIRAAEDAVFELFGQAAHPLVIIVRGGFVEVVEEKVGGHDFAGFEGTGGVVPSLVFDFWGWRKFNGVADGDGGALIYEELCLGDELKRENECEGALPFEI